MMSKQLESVQKIPAFAVIIRAIHERGENQRLALAELNRRGLWLTDEQKRQAGLAALLCALLILPGCNAATLSAAGAAYSAPTYYLPAPLPAQGAAPPLHVICQQPADIVFCRTY